MLQEYVWQPISCAFSGIFEYASVKVAILLAGFPFMLILDIFSTPHKWWIGLLALVIMDWTAGMLRAIKNGNFDFNTATRKWYQVAGYIYACGAVAILSNTFPDIFYYLQFGAYAAFFLKEFVSILKTFRLLAFFSLVWDIAKPDGRNKFEKMDDFFEEVKRRSQTEN